MLLRLPILKRQVKKHNTAYAIEDGKFIGTNVLNEAFLTKDFTMSQMKTMIFEQKYHLLKLRIRF